MSSNDRSPEETEGLVHQLELQRTQLEAENRRLQQYRDRYVDLYDSAPVGYATLDEDGYVQEINLTGARLLGAERDSLTGFPLAEYVAKEDQEAFLDHLRQCLQGQREVTSELTLVARSGRSFTVQLHSILAKSVEGTDDTHCRTAIIDITERRQMEETIRQSQAFLQTVIDSIPDPMLVIDRDHHTVLANRAAREMAGETDPVSRCLTCYWLAHQSDLSCASQNQPCPLQQVVASKAPRMVTHTRHGIDGQETFVEVVAAPVLNKAGEVAHIIEMRRDITERQRAVEALRQSEDRLRLALQASDTGWWEWDFITDVLDGDAKVKGLLGLPADEPIRSLDRVLGRTHPEDWDRLQQRATELKARPGDYEVEFRVTWPDSSVHWVFAKGRSLDPSGGKPIRAMGIAMDITPRKQAEEQLRKVAQFPEENPNPVLRVSNDGRLLYVNRAASDKLAKMDWHADRPVPAALNSLVQRALRSGGNIEQEVEGAEGRLFSFVVTPVTGTEYVNLYGRDVTDRKQAEEELKAARESAERARAAAEQANRAKDHFLAVLSHELRTPLTPVVMGVSLLQNRPDLDPLIRETLEMVRRNAEMESRLIDDLLDVARIARGKIELTRSAVELCTVINRAVDVCKPDIEARSLHFGVDLGPAVPYWVEADVSRLQQVFWNLLKNAIKFTPHGGCVGIRCRPNEKYVVAEVNDSGMGIEPEALPRIFNAFEQVEQSITRQFGGLGLGLAISKALVEMHGGTIEVHSEGRDKGATFRVRLPLTAPAGQPEAPAPAAPRKRAARPLRILLVEDHGVTAKMMQMVLTSDGHTVETAGDVATALELVGQHTFDLLLSDLGLPDGSGHDLMRQLRERGQTLPGIALSGYGQEEDIRRSYGAGFAAHLTKPASRERLLEAITAVTSGEPTITDAPTIGSEPSLQVGSPPVNADSSIFNQEEAIRRCHRREEVFQRMVEIFFTDVDCLFPQMRAALQKGDMVQLGHLGHRLKGTIVHLGAQHAEDAALRVEQFVKRPVPPPEAEEAINALERECETLKIVLGKYQYATVSHDEAGNGR